MQLKSRQIINFSELDKADFETVGKKAYQLAELKYLKIPIPDGFVIVASQMSEDLTKDIYGAYKKLCGLFNEPFLNIFTSSLNNKSIRFLNVKGDANLILKIKTILALPLDKHISIVVQKNLRSKTRGKFITNGLSIDKKFAAIAKKIQNHFYFPQEVEYVIEKGRIYITSIKPLTDIYQPKQLQQNKRIQKILAKGTSIYPGIVTGPARILRNQNFIQIKNGEIIVVSQLDKSVYRKIHRAKGIITDAILPIRKDKILHRKDVKIPIIFGVKNADKIIQNGNIVTVNGGSGEIYSGGLI